MGGKVQSGVFLHDQACAVAEGIRQSAVVAAGQNQTAVNAAEIAYARAVVASCKTNNNNVGAEPYQTLLRALGTGGI